MAGTARAPRRAGAAGAVEPARRKDLAARGLPTRRGAGWARQPGRLPGRRAARSATGRVGMAAEAVASETRSVEFGILGPLEVRRSGQAVSLGGPRQRAVLALLLLEANRVVSMDRLAEDVWGGKPPEGWAT